MSLLWYSNLSSSTATAQLPPLAPRSRPHRPPLAPLPGLPPLQPEAPRRAAAGREEGGPYSYIDGGGPVKGVMGLLSKGV